MINKIDPFEEYKKKIFLSYYHKYDQHYCEHLEQFLSNRISARALVPGRIDAGDSQTYIKKLSDENYINDQSVIVILVGDHTKECNYIDWDIYAGLSLDSFTKTGIVGIILPEIVDESDWLSFMHPRLADNVNSGYAKMYTWDYFKDYNLSIVEEAYKNRFSLRDKAINDKPLMP